MRIDSSVIGMESARRYTSSTTRTGRYAIMSYKDAAAKGMAGNNMAGNLLNMGTGQKGDGETVGQSQQDAAGNTTGKPGSLEELQAGVSRMRMGRINMREQWSKQENMHQLSLRYIFNLLFGSEKTKDIWGEDSIQPIDEQTQNLGEGELGNNQYLVYHNQVSFYESENVSFQAGGTVRTADGREINFNVDVEMSREFSAYYEENYEKVSLRTCDPLVINLDGDIAELSDQKFFFDIDGDGAEDEISMLNEGSGYLALDKNGDGKINDGKELFGPQSGNGFQDLAAYDEDGNGWIDEGDSIWSKLKIWCKDKDGTDKLYGLSEKGVGAICLQNASTNFTLNGSGQQPGGYIRNTGVFLYENGNVGTVQHVDMVK